MRLRPDALERIARARTRPSYSRAERRERDARLWRALTDARRAEVYSYARDFALDCDWTDRETLDADGFAALLDALAPVALVTDAARHYSGGLVALLLDSRGTA